MKNVAFQMNGFGVTYLCESIVMNSNVAANHKL